MLDGSLRNFGLTGIPIVLCFTEYDQSIMVLHSHSLFFLLLAIFFPMLYLVNLEVSLSVSSFKIALLSMEI